MANVKSDKITITQENFDDLQKQLRYLLDVERPQNQEELALARSQGDLSENADYDAARNKQAEIEANITRIQSILDNCVIAEEKDSKNKITATSTVTIYDEEEGEEITYTLVGSITPNPAENKITTESALGAAILGKEKGDEVEIICGDGSSYKVIIRDIK